MVAEGQVFATWRHGKVGGTFPDTLDEELGRVTRRVYTDLDRTSFLDLLDRPTPTGPSQFEDVGLFATYGPAPYLPAALGIDVGRVFGASALAMTYLARILQVVAYIAIVALAIRRIPVHKWIVVVAALVPAVLFQAASVSADAEADRAASSRVGTLKTAAARPIGPTASVTDNPKPLRFYLPP